MPVRIAATCARIANDWKGTDVTVLDLNGLSTIADYFVIASGRSVRQLRSIAFQIERMAKENGLTILGVEGTQESKWILIDLAFVVVHLFDAHTRTIYDLELLWGDAARVEWEKVEPLAFTPVGEAGGFALFVDRPSGRTEDASQ